MEKVLRVSPQPLNLEKYKQIFGLSVLLVTLTPQTLPVLDSHSALKSHHLGNLLSQMRTWGQ